MNSLTKDILTLVKGKKDIVFDKEINKDTVVIVDFFNIYCNIVKFNRYKTFSRETYILCIKLLLKKLKGYKVIIISKNIFEIENSYIQKLTTDNKNIEYVIVEDTYIPKSNNRERDDYVCIFFNKMLIKNSCIISNDKYKNLESMLYNTKPFNMKIYKDNKINTMHVNKELIKKYNEELKRCIPETSGFKLIRFSKRLSKINVL